MNKNQSDQELNMTSADIQSNEQQAFYPWRRFLARMLDLALYSFLWVLILELALNINSTMLYYNAPAICLAAALIIMLAVEPLLLMLFGFTPGKLIMGLRLESREGVRIGYKMGVARCFGVLLWGMGLGIPLFNIFRLWKSYKQCRDNEPLSWDYDYYYTIKDLKPKRPAILAASMALLIALNVGIFAAPRLPLNRGAINVEQFAQNYNKYADYYFGTDYIYEMNVNGQIVDNSSDTEIVIDISATPVPVFEYALDANGNISTLTFTAEKHGGEGIIGSAFTNEMTLCALSLAAAQKDVNVFTSHVQEIIKTIEEKPYESFAFTIIKAEILCNYTYGGYEYAPPFIIREETDADAYYRVNFKINMQ